ncbi:MAG: biotin-dependent carboxyltransferase family protein [Blastocatellia bacterium]|nr:biotin-dependent carboxyltransferase family protein [Blastocatellia bacterium]
MSILVEKAGILTTIQDGGRFGYRSLGINVSGPMDPFAMQVANILVGNKPDDAVIETHFPAAEIEFEADTHFAIAGAEMTAILDDVPLRNWSSYRADRGQRLRFERPSFGSRSYIAIAGGFQTTDWLGSRATNLAAKCGSFGRPLANGDRLEKHNICENSSSLTVSPWMLPRYNQFPTVRVLSGPEFHLLNEDAVNHLTNENYTISNGSDRMGFRLEGEPLNCTGFGEMPSAAVTFGTIQLLPDGKLIILMADHQTSGGYPRIATIAAVDLPLVGQLGAGDGVSFAMIDRETAESLLIERYNDLEQLRRGVALFGKK